MLVLVRYFFVRFVFLFPSPALTASIINLLRYYWLIVGSCASFGGGERSCCCWLFLVRCRDDDDGNQDDDDERLFPRNPSWHSHCLACLFILVDYFLFCFGLCWMIVSVVSSFLNSPFHSDGTFRFGRMFLLLASFEPSPLFTCLVFYCLIIDSVAGFG